MHFQQDRTQLSINKAVFIFWRFYAGYRLPLVGITGAALALVMALAYHSYGNAVRQAALSDAARLSKSSETAIVPMSGLTPPKENLTEFRSSHLLAILEEGASAADIKLDEITFVIDTSPNQPYVRYRASFQVLSRYPTVRKFISEILAGSQGVVLDTVACWRENINVVDVRCDISAYVAYQEDAGG